MNTKTRLTLTALAAALMMTAAPAAFADPDGLRGEPRSRADFRYNGPPIPPPPVAPVAPPAWRDDRGAAPAIAPSDWRGDRRGGDWRNAGPDYRNPHAFVNVSFRERFERLEGWIGRNVERGTLSRRDARWLVRQLDDTRALAISYRRSHDAYTVWEADEIDARLDRIRYQIRDQRREDQWTSWRNDDWRGRGPSGF